MLLSIIIPVYNAEKYLEECMASVLAEIENDDKIEVLLLDDGSTDESSLLCQKYENKQTRVFHHKNHGVSYTRNRGIEEATGDYIMFIDADDRLLQGWRKIVYDGAQLGCDVVYFSGKITNSKASCQDIIDSIFGVLEQGSLGTMASPVSRLYRRNYLLMNSIRFNEKLINGEDAIFNLEVITRTGSYALIVAPIYQYRINHQSSSRRYDPCFYDSNLEYLRLAENILAETHAVPPQRKKGYLAHSFCYSVYLLLFRISTLQSANEQKEALKNFTSKEMQKYFAKFADYQEINKLWRVFYKLALNRQYARALCLMKGVNVLRKARKRKVAWETM